MSYKKAIYNRDHPQYAEPTEYLTMEVDGLTVALHFRREQDSSDTKGRIEDTLMLAGDMISSKKSA